MAKRKNNVVATAGEQRIAELEATLNSRLGDAPPITGDEMQAIRAAPSKWPAGEGPMNTPGGMGIYADGLPIKDIPRLIEWLKDFRQLIANSSEPERLLTHVRGALKAGYRWRRFFTQTGTIPDLSAVTIAETVESRLVELIDDLQRGLPPTSEDDKAPTKEQKSHAQTSPTVADQTRKRKLLPRDIPILESLSQLEANSVEIWFSSSRIAENMRPPRTRDKIRDGLDRLRDGQFVKSIPHGNQGGYQLTAKGRKQLPNAKAKRKTK